VSSKTFTEREHLLAVVTFWTCQRAAHPCVGESGVDELGFSASSLFSSFISLS